MPQAPESPVVQARERLRAWAGRGGEHYESLEELRADLRLLLDSRSVERRDEFIGLIHQATTPPAKALLALAYYMLGDDPEVANSIWDGSGQPSALGGKLPAE